MNIIAIEKNQAYGRYDVMSDIAKKQYNLLRGYRLLKGEN